MISDSLHYANLYENEAFPYIMFTINHNLCSPSGPGYRYLHWHEELQYTLVKNGSLTMQINGVDYQLLCGDAIFINSGLLHMTKNISSNGSYISFNFHSKLLSIFKESNMEKYCVLPYLTNYTCSPLLMKCAEPQYQKELMILKQLHSLNVSIKEPLVQYQVSSLLINLWLNTITKIEPPCSKPNVIDKRKQEYLYRMLSYVHMNYAADLTLKDIAFAAYVSTSECYRCFKKILHITPYGYLLNFRITKGMELLTETNNSIAEIATAIGFNDSSHFIQYFKKLRGCTPNEYRNNNLNT